MSTASYSIQSRVRGTIRSWNWRLSVAAHRMWRLRVPVFTRFHGDMRLVLYAGDTTAWSIFNDGYFEPEECQFVARFLRPGMTFIDIGANIGQYTLLAARQVGPSGQVHSFEPTPTTFRRLRSNVRRNRLGNVRLNQLAISDGAGTAELSLCDPSEGEFNSLGSPERPVIRKCLVTTRDLDAYVQEKSIDRVHLIKVDAEGAERQILLGARELLNRPDAPVLLLELNEQALAGNGTSGAELCSVLASSGYEFHEFRNGSVKQADLSIQMNTRNVIASKSPLHLDAIG